MGKEQPITERSGWGAGVAKRERWDERKMKIYIEHDNGTIIPVKEIENCGRCDLLLFKITSCLNTETINNLEVELSTKTGRKCIILCPYVDKVYAIG